MSILTLRGRSGNATVCDRVVGERDDRPCHERVWIRQARISVQLEDDSPEDNIRT